jgi:hypothetical protein
MLARPEPLHLPPSGGREGSVVKRSVFSLGGDGAGSGFVLASVAIRARRNCCGRSLAHRIRILGIRLSNTARTAERYYGRIAAADVRNHSQ